MPDAVPFRAALETAERELDRRPTFTRDAALRSKERAPSLPTALRAVDALALLAGFLTLAGVVSTLPFGPGWDATTYLGAGERLNLGHALYGLTDGDRLIAQAQLYGSPLLSPPPIAVLWRPLALLGDASLVVWWAACVVSILLVAALLLARSPVIGAAGIAVLALPLDQELMAGNVNGLLMAAVLATWLLQRSGRDRAAGALVALMTAMKLWPIVLLAWFVGQRRWGAIQGFVLGGVVIACISVLGSGVDAHLAYLGVAARIAPSPLSLAAHTGLPWIGWAVLGVALMVVLVGARAREMTFAVAVVAMVISSPVLYVNHLAVLLTALVPFAWSLPAKTGATAPSHLELRRSLASVLAALAAFWLAVQYAVPAGLPQWTPAVAAVLGGIGYYWLAKSEQLGHDDLERGRDVEARGGLHAVTP